MERAAVISDGHAIAAHIHGASLADAPGTATQPRSALAADEPGGRAEVARLISRYQDAVSPGWQQQGGRACAQGLVQPSSSIVVR